MSWRIELTTNLRAHGRIQSPVLVAIVRPPVHGQKAANGLKGIKSIQADIACKALIESTQHENANAIVF